MSPDAGSPNDQRVLGFLAEQQLTDFTFDGLQRSLHLHPETLSRCLSRLEAEGLLEKRPDGYHVVGSLPSRAVLEPQQRLLLSQTLLPGDLAVREVVSVLRGRWFGSLRWLGSSRRDSVLVMKWVREDGGLTLQATLEGGFLTVEAGLSAGLETDEAVRAGYLLLEQIAPLYARRPRAQLASFILLDAGLTPAAM